MKTGRKMIVILVCVALLFSLSVVAYAARSQTFFRVNSNGYQCVGKGTVSQDSATASITATPIPNEPHIPEGDCYTKTWILAYDGPGSNCGGTYSEGTTAATATYVSKDGKVITHIGCQFTFLSAVYGPYLLYS